VLLTKPLQKKIPAHKPDRADARKRVVDTRTKV